MKKNIYYIEDRGWPYIYHFICYMIGGLHLIDEKEYPINIYLPYLLKDVDQKDEDVINNLTNNEHLDKKYQGNYTYLENFNHNREVTLHLQILEMIKHKYNVIFTLKDYNLEELEVARRIF